MVLLSCTVKILSTETLNLETFFSSLHQRKKSKLSLVTLVCPKLLDPDSLTSGMSSNVGTNLFKAPEFWNHKPGAAVKYHRNIDVYSAGLTFTAMLQAMPDNNLFPTAEGSLNDSETIMPIGFAANTRMAYHQPEFQVVENKPDDDETTKEVKEIIRLMTCACSKKRLSSRMVKQRLDKIVQVSCVEFIHSTGISNFSV